VSVADIVNVTHTPAAWLIDHSAIPTLWLSQAAGVWVTLTISATDTPSAAAILHKIAMLGLAGYRQCDPYACRLAD
jgi:hypothetical protein